PYDERSALLDAAEYLNGRMREIRDSGKVVGLDRVAVMVALNMAHELLQIRGRDAKVEGEAGGKVRALRERVETALERAQQLELWDTRPPKRRGLGVEWLPASPAVFDKRAGLPRTLIETPTGQGSSAALCKSAMSGKPYLSQLVPLVAQVREQRSAPAHAGGAS